MYSKLALASALFSVVRGQHIGTNTAEVHPKLSTQKCTKAGGCVTQATSIVLDANWRWLHKNGGTTNCYSGNTWDATLCPDATTCAKKCALDGADYTGTYGITASGSSLKLNFVTSGANKNVGSRVFLMDTTGTKYQEFNLLNQEFTFDVDLTTLPCGLNGALYFSQMVADGGMSAQPNNKAGASYGTGYCDSQCPKDLKFIGGQANNVGWTPDANSANSGKGTTGSCCAEMDIWEANKVSAAYTPHPCSPSAYTPCTGTACTSTCDQAGCDFNSYRMGNNSFYGPGATIDTSKVFTVVTQFITDSGTATGNLKEIRRQYVQGGRVVANSNSNIAGIPASNSLTDSSCAAQKTVFGDTNTFASKGGLTAMGNAFKAGMVLVLSIWDDYAVDMLWLDSDYPIGADATKPGVARGTCATTSGAPTDVESSASNAYVTYSNIKYGDIGSTFSGGPAAPAPPAPGPSSSTTVKAPTRTPSPPSGGGTVAHYGQCGGQGWTGATACVAPHTCKVSNAYYSQCL